MKEYIKLLFEPNEKNNFCPKIIGSGALFAYAVLVVLVFLAISPLLQMQTNRLLADLTQDLIIKEVNPVREKNSLLKLNISKNLSAAAQAKAEDMIKKDYFSHTGPDGKRPWEWIKEAGYNYASAGENLAINFSDPIALVNAWMNSPSHAKNILNGYFENIGVGIAKGEFKGKEATIAVMFLGRKISEHSKTAKVLAVSDQEIPPEEPIVIENIEKPEFLNNQIGIEVGRLEEVKNFQNTETKIFLVNKFPLFARLAITIFFNVLILFSLFSYFIRKENYLLRISNTLAILALLTLLWIPEIL